MRLGILGGGRAAWAFGSSWKRIGWPLAGVWLRDTSTSRVVELLQTERRSIDELARDADLLLVAVSDRAIVEVMERVPETNAILFHASGAMLSMRGGFSLHPLRSLPPVGATSDLANTLLVFEGMHREIAQRITTAIGARFCEIAAEQKALYHAAAVFGSNYVAASLEIAHRLMARAGVTDVRQDLVALAQSALENWRTHDDAKRFTGPAARGDEAVMQQHRDVLQGDAQVAQLYELLAAEIATAILARSK